jgi:hypothetical protein
MSSIAHDRDDPERQRHAAVKRLVRYRGVALRLHLVAMYETQLRKFERRPWVAGPLAEHHDWRDPIVGGNLDPPSWASLVLGYEQPPDQLTDYQGWRRSRYEAVVAGFNRLGALGLLDVDTNTLTLEDLPRRRRAAASLTYHSIDEGERSFEVRSELFTSGAYLRLSGVAIHTYLVEEFERHNAPISSMVSRYGLTRSGYDLGLAELARVGVSSEHMMHR